MNWVDRLVEYPNRYTITDNGDGTHTIEESPGTVEEEGTPVNASNLNNLYQTFYVTISTDDWVDEGDYFSNTVSVGGILSSDDAIVDIDLTGLSYSDKLSQLRDWTKLIDVTIDDDEITVESINEFSTDIDIILQVMR